jgi:UPF0716 protein FxsA
MLLLLYSLFILIDCYVLILLSGRFGIFLILAVAGITGLGGFLLFILNYSVQLREMRKQLKRGEYPRKSFSQISGLVLAGVLLITPGFLTDALGLFLLLNPFRLLAGLAVTALYRENFKEAYEYLKLKDH